jgi:hypothetical protein
MWSPWPCPSSENLEKIVVIWCRLLSTYFHSFLSVHSHRSALMLIFIISIGLRGLQSWLVFLIIISKICLTILCSWQMSENMYSAVDIKLQRFFQGFLKRDKVKVITCWKFVKLWFGKKRYRHMFELTKTYNYSKGLLSIQLIDWLILWCLTLTSCKICSRHDIA